MEKDKTKEEIFLEKLLENNLTLTNEYNNQIKIMNVAKQKFKCYNSDGYVIYLSYNQLTSSSNFNMQIFLKTNKSKALNIMNFIKTKENHDYLNILNENSITEDSKIIELECLLCEDIFDLNIEEFSKSKKHICSCRDTDKSGQLDKIIKEISEINKSIEIIKQPYRGVQTKLECKCLINDNHKNFFSNVPHLRRGQGCPECKTENLKERFKSSIEELREDMLNINSNIIIVSEEYINSDTHVKCKCLIDGHEWSASPGNLRQGYGCPECSKPDFFNLQRNELNKDDWKNIQACVYAIKIEITNDVETFFKIGFSSNVNKRIKSITDEYKKDGIEAVIDITDTINCSKYQAIIIEKHLLEKFKDYRYKPNNYFKGETECFSSNEIIRGFKIEKDNFMSNQSVYIDNVYRKIGGVK